MILATVACKYTPIIPLKLDIPAIGFAEVVRPAKLIIAAAQPRFSGAQADGVQARHLGQQDAGRSGRLLDGSRQRLLPHAAAAGAPRD